MKRAILLVLMAVSLCACNTVRKAIGVVDAAANAVGGVKDDVIGAANTLVNSAEAVKTNVTAAVKSTSDAATK